MRKVTLSLTLSLPTSLHLYIPSSIPVIPVSSESRYKGISIPSNPDPWDPDPGLYPWSWSQYHQDPGDPEIPIQVAFEKIRKVTPSITLSISSYLPPSLYTSLDPDNPGTPVIPVSLGSRYLGDSRIMIIPVIWFPVLWWWSGFLLVCV